ncbi:MAG TPA: MFS transporter [Dehalococcoidales bacterium]|nr:MFS transporter [Dehalococcoidales bacterium]
MNSHDLSAPTLSYRRAITTFVVVSLALLMASIDMSIVAVSLPHIMRDLNTSLAWTSWIMTGAQLSQCIMMPIIGKLSDDWGRKRLFLIAAIIFTLSSLAAGFAPNIYVLIIFRVLQGLSGGAFLPSATGIISDAFGERRATYIGLFASIFPIGGIIGPNLGGFLVDSLSWRWTFYINVPIGILLIILGYIIFPKGKISATRRGIDFKGAGLFAGAIIAILYAVTHWANNPQSSGLITWILLSAGIVLLFLFYRHENRAVNPMIDLQLLRWRPFFAANLYNFVYGAVVFGIFAFIPYYSALYYDMTAAQTGLVLTPRSIAMVVMAALCSFLLIKFRYRLPMITGTVLSAASLFILGQGFKNMTLAGQVLPDMVLMMMIMALGGIGMGIANPAANNAILDLVPDKVASVTGMRGMFRISGGILGTAGVVLTLSFYQDKALGLQHIAIFYGVMLLLLIPLIYLIPDNARNKSRKGLMTAE